MGSEIRTRAPARARNRTNRIDYDYGSAEWAWQPVQETFHDFKNFGTIRFR